MGMNSQKELKQERERMERESVKTKPMMTETEPIDVMGDSNAAALMNATDNEVDTSKETPQDATPELISDILKNPDVAKYIEKAVQDGVKKALKGEPPKADMTEPTQPTDEQRKIFHRMNYKERLNLYLSNPIVYNALMQKGK